MTEHTKTCYSHWGEDMVLAHVFEGTDKGRYLDVGCYHPSFASVVAVEDFGFRFKAPNGSKLYALLVESGYQMFSRTIYTSFFIESGFNAATHQFA